MGLVRVPVGVTGREGVLKKRRTGLLGVHRDGSGLDLSGRKSRT